MRLSLTYKIGDTLVVQIKEFDTDNYVTAYGLAMKYMKKLNCDMQEIKLAKGEPTCQLHQKT